jgi:hypothetical protein
MSKKKFFGTLAVLAIAAMTAFNVSVNMQENRLSDIALSNIEALATEYDWHENRTDRYDSRKKCYQQCVDDGTGCAYVYDFPYNC